MDLIKFPPAPGPSLTLTGAELVENWDSVTWIERFNEPGEFTIESKISSGVEQDLPIGTLISHINTSEMMIVENHEIHVEEDQETTIKITGRSFTSFLENRYVGSQIMLGDPEDIPDYPYPDFLLTSDKSWNQIAHLINLHIYMGYGPIVYGDGIKNVFAAVGSSLSSAAATGNETDRRFKKQDLYSAVKELLAVDGLGLRAVRPGKIGMEYGLYEAIPDYLVLEIFKPQNKSKEVAFSHEFGDIRSADYLRSIKSKKNAVLVSGKWIDLIRIQGLAGENYNTPETGGIIDYPITITDFVNFGAGYNRRWGMIKANEFDDRYSEAPSTLEDLMITTPPMGQKADRYLNTMNEMSISNVQIAMNLTRNRYRDDYQLGDFVGVNGEYDVDTYMQVSEYVEIEDENGTNAYPTLVKATRPEETLDT